MNVSDPAVSVSRTSPLGPTAGLLFRLATGPRKWYNYGGGDENNSYPADPVRGISRADEDQKR
jgi:hypothetical protein